MQTLIIMTTILGSGRAFTASRSRRYAQRWCERSDGACQSNRATFADPRPSSGRQWPLPQLVAGADEVIE